MNLFLFLIRPQSRLKNKKLTFCIRKNPGLIRGFLVAFLVAFCKAKKHANRFKPFP